MTATAIQLPVIQARCLWCRNRIGVARFRVAGEWMELPGAEIVQDLSDGICPLCLEISLKNLNQTKIKNVL
jgi:hypothetical protein